VPLLFEAALDSPARTTLDGLTVTVRLSNDGADSRWLPGPSDRSGALSFEVTDPSGQLVRRMSALTEQASISAGRVESRVTLEELPAGAVWQWPIDLVSHGGPLPAGDFFLLARYQHPPEAVDLAAGPFPVQILDPEMQSVSALRDNPVLDGLTLLVRAGLPDGQTGFYLQQYNFPRPLAPLYAHAASSGAWGQASLFCAAADYFQTDRFDPAFSKWLVAFDGLTVEARRFTYGRPDDLPPRQAVLPQRGWRLRAVFRTIDEQLHLAFQNGDGDLELMALDDQGARPLFSHLLARTCRRPLAVTAFGGELHLVYPAGGLVHERLDLRGQRLDLGVVDTRLPVEDWRCDPVDRRAKVTLRDGPRGQVVELLCLNLEDGARSSLPLGRLPLRGALRELAFDCDRAGRFHLAVSTARGALYYVGEGGGPRLLARGGGIYFPIVAASRRCHVGFRRPGRGYAFTAIEAKPSAESPELPQ
jgi:hypothetical protein